MSLDPPRPADAFARTRGVLEALSLLLGAGLAGWALFAFASGARDDFEDLALGAETQAYFAEVDGLPIHCGDLRDADRCVEGHLARGGRPVVLWFGNSQIHAINQLEPGDETAPPILFRSQGRHGRDVLAFSQPNANPQEHLVLFAYLADRLPLDTLVLSLVFDDFRESAVRSSLAEALADASVAGALRRYAVGRTILENNRQQAGGDDLAALEGTVQQRTEKTLNDWLQAHWRLWELRANTRGELFNELHRLRNTVFGITAQSKRRVIPGRLDLNLAAVQAMLEEAGRRGVRAIVYIAPLRGDVEVPYFASDYRRFKQAAEEMARASGAIFANLEDAVPDDLWGRKDATVLGGGAEIDFMHFQGPGHVLLAAQVDALVNGARGVTAR